MSVTNSLWTRTRVATSTIRLSSFDASTAEGRSQERYRRAALTTIASIGAKGITTVTAVISVPLTIGYLGTERYGVWMTISATIAMLSFADLGIGNGLLNALSESNGKDDREAAREYVSSAFFMLSGIAGVMAFCFALTYPFIPWARVFNISSALGASEAGPATMVFAGCFLINIPLGIVQRVQMGYQEGFANSVWLALGGLLGLGGILLAVYFRAGLPWLVLAMGGAPAVATVLNGAVLFGVRRPWLLPSWRRSTRKAAARVLHIGILFLVLQMAVAVAFSSDNIVAAQVIGPEAVTQYAVPFRMFSVVSMILIMLLSPLWPAYGESIARGDIQWVKRTFLRSVLIAFLLASVASVLLVGFGREIISLWVGPKVVPSLLLLAGLGIWSVLSAIGNAVAMFLNGANIIRFQVVCAILVAASAILAKILLTQLIGIPGVVWGTVIAYTVLSLIPTVVIVPKLLRAMEQRSREVRTA